MELKTVFSAITIGGIEIKNRVRMSPMALGYAEDGRVTSRFVKFFEERARGGVGLIDWALWPYKTEHGYFPWVYDDRFIPGLKDVVDAVHKYGTKIVGQFGTGYAWAFNNGPVEIVGPSGISLLKRPSTPFRVGTPTNRRRLSERALTVEEIHDMVKGYGQAARRLREAGFDGVELMLAAGYTLARFISPETNKRTDEYGGNLDNRMRIVREIVEEIKKCAGNDFPIFAKISGATFTKKGYSLEECATEIVPRLEDMGICAVDVVVGWHEAPQGMLSNSVEPLQYLFLAETVKKNTKIPVIWGDRTNDLRVVEPVLADGKIDMITLGRQLIADPETCNKAKEGRYEDIRPCICCAWCLETVDTPVICSVNPRAGREFDYEIKPALKPKRVLVIGGGPAGMEATLTASKRGHKVTIIEKESKLGGMLEPASLPPFKQDIGYLLDYYRRQMRKCNAEVLTGRKVTIKDVIEFEPDVVVVATGTTPIIPNVSGIAKKNVVLAVDTLYEKVDVGQEVVVIGGGMVGCEVAEFLARKGKKVIVVEMLHRAASDVPRALRFDLMMRLARLNVQIETDVEVKRISKHGVWGVRTSYEYGPNEVYFEADTIVLAVGYKPENSIAEEVSGKMEVYNIGDSNQPGKIKDAIWGGFLTGLNI